MRELLVLAVIFVFIIYVRFIGIFYSPETPSDLDYWSLHANAPEPGGPPFLPVR